MQALYPTKSKASTPQPARYFLLINKQCHLLGIVNAFD